MFASFRALLCLGLTMGIASGKETVVLLHGLARSDRSMSKLASALAAEGYDVINVDYASTKAPIDRLAGLAIGPALTKAKARQASRVHFVTHSMGGILVRQYLKTHSIERLGRVVMLGPPNQGSEIVDKLGDSWIFSAINGPAGRQLGTKPGSLPNQLGPVDFDLGVIAGDRSINWINSLLIAGRDDGKVSVERTKVAGMTAHLVIHATHPYLMKNPRAIRETLHFLREGKFISTPETLRATKPCPPDRAAYPRCVRNQSAPGPGLASKAPCQPSTCSLLDDKRVGRNL